MNLRILFLIFIFFLFACGNDKKNGDTRKIFRYNSASGISSLDPAFAKDQANIWAVNMLYNGLLTFDKDLNIQPSVAKKWTISEDGLLYTFYLRDDVFFHDDAAFPNGKGRKVTAADVAYSFTRLMDPKTVSPGTWILNDRIVNDAPFVVVNDSVFQIKLVRPFRPLLSILTMQYTFIVPKEAVDLYGADFRVHPVGTGPFKLKVLQEGNVLILAKNENYFKKENGEQLPFLDGVKVTFIQSKQTEYLNFLKGDLDFLSGLDASYINELLTKEGELQPQHTGNIHMFKTAYLNSEYLGFLMNDADEKNPLKNKLIRQAISYGFDRDAIIRYLRNNTGKSATAGFIPYGLPSFDKNAVKGYSYDPAKTKQLLKEAGFPDGKNLPEIPLYTSSTYEDIATFIQKQLKESGIQIKLELVPPAFQRELMSKGEAKFFRGSWIADYPDAETYLAMFYSKHGAPPNYTRFSSATFDSLYLVALNENDDDARYDLYRKMDQIIIDSAVVIPLFYDEVVRFVRKEVKGMEPNPMNLLDLEKVKK